MKGNKPLLVVKYIEVKKEIFSRYASRLKMWAKDIFEANKGFICRLNAITTKKLKKGRIRKVKYSITIPLNPGDIDELNCLTGNTKWRETFFLEYRKLLEMGSFKMMTELEWLLGLF